VKALRAKPKRALAPRPVKKHRSHVPVATNGEKKLSCEDEHLSAIDILIRQAKYENDIIRQMEAAVRASDKDTVFRLAQELTSQAEKAEHTRDGRHNENTDLGTAKSPQVGETE
jgi:hypothetical protein